MSAGRYARAIAAECGAELPAGFDDPGEVSPAEEWARSGALSLCGNRDGPPVLPSAPLPSCARGAGRVFCHLSAAGAAPFVLDAAALLGERAALEGLERNGRISPGGACRLLCARDGWFAAGLPRGAEDHRLFPAWLGAEAGEAPWSALAAAAAQLRVEYVVGRGRLLGLPVAGARRAHAVPPWLRIGVVGTAGPPRRPDAVTVADLTSLWAGPLAGGLLHQAGARVAKVESCTRPDGAREGSPALHALLNAGKRPVACAFVPGAAGAALRRELDAADVVLEASRPRALRQLGVVAEDWVAARPGRVWCSITGYGRTGPGAACIALGDDAAVAAGAALAVPAQDAPLFVGDAVADPLTGLHAALAVAASLARGGGELLDVSLAGVVARALREAPGDEAAVERGADGWGVVTGGGFVRATSPRARRPDATRYSSWIT